MTRSRRWFRSYQTRITVLTLFACAWASAQSVSSEHAFPVSRADLDQAVSKIHATTPGRLPILDGFVDPETSALDKYQRAYYQYKLEFRVLTAGTTSLRVTARITAWYAGDKNSPAGYRSLPSNGRLETDLVERLQEALQQKSGTVAGEAVPPSHELQSSAQRDATPPTPQTPVRDPALPPATSTTPVPSKPSIFGLNLPAESNARPGLTSPDSLELAKQKRVQQLTEQAANLDEILRNQSHPNDLAAVLRTGTPVLAKPVEPGEVLFHADAEDEFKILGETGGWVHVQVSGISRGWIRRSELEMPGESAPAPPPLQPQSSATDSKLETHEETSLFPGEWPALRGHIVRITWVRPGTASTADRWQLARTVFRNTYGHITRDALKVDGITIVLDAADGGMIAATSDSLRRWNTGAISDAAFRKECWADSPEVLGETAKRENGANPRNP